jgi:alpha-1,2-mannosyltransferase
MLPSMDPPADNGRSTAGVILLWVLIAATGLRLALIHPAQDYLLDFRAYYAAGAAATAGIDPYDTARVRAHVTLPGRQTIVGYLYPPPTLWLFAGFAQLPYPAAQIPWLLLQFGLAVASLGLILRALHCPFGSPASVLLGFAFLSSTALSELFRWGQFDMIVLFLLTLAVLAMLRDHPFRSGLWLAAAAVAKVTPITYLAVFLLRRQWKAAVTMLGAAATLCAAALLWPGHDACLSWLSRLGSFSGDTQSVISPNNMSLHGFLYRLFAEHPTHRGMSTPWIDLGLQNARWLARLSAATLGLITAAWMWRWRRTLSTAECLCAAIPLVLLLSPITWSHHCVQLLPPLALIIAGACRSKRAAKVDLLGVVLIVLLLVVGGPGRIESATKPWLNHLITPTTTYAVGLTWLFLVTRYVPLKQAATQPAPWRGPARLAAPLPSLANHEPAPATHRRIRVARPVRTV